ncbi:LysR family transcriptional regulator [Microbacterium album]|uniref:LysR family transcriptional regulator n=1 Tax=Microbacterium album TaxID=2053191 RepID=A0A917IC14_9MICO|nr:LysR family transcriptional regulator [Microbacterium album]GGH33574.1 LysR family transcriptional regulator [Microbacterium album]
MGGDDPDLNLLVALRALLEEANVTRAGERIGMGQSTMSAALSRLRGQFEDELLVRVGRDYELTPLARQLLPQVQLTIPLVERALGVEQTFDPSEAQRRFRVQLTDYAAVELRPYFRLLRAARGLRFDLRRLPESPAEGERDLLAHDFVVAVPGMGIHSDSVELFRDEYVVIADRENPAIGGGQISLDDFLALPHVRCDFGPGHVTGPERRMHELDLTVDVRVTTSSLLPIPLIVSGTDLISVVPRRLVERNSGMTGTVAVPTPFETVVLIERLWWHPAHSSDPAHAWVRETIAAAARGGVPET